MPGKYHFQPFQLSLILLVGGCCGPCCPDPLETGMDTAAIVMPDSGDSDDPGATESGDPDEPIGVHGTIEGTVDVQLFELDENGDLAHLQWEDSCFGDTFPYGAIFVTAYTTDESTGQETYFTEDVIPGPSTDPSENTYSLSVDTDLVDEVLVYAVLDKWGDRLINSDDPRGTYGSAVAISDGETVEGIDISIATQYWCGEGDCPDCPPSWGNGSGWYWDGSGWAYGGGGGGGGGGGSGRGCEYMNLGGELLIEVPYNGSGSDVATYLMYAGSDIPYAAKLDHSVSAVGDGAQGSWGWTLCHDSGTYDVRGCWDSNGNLLYDPDDTWGVPVDSSGAADATVNIGTEDISRSLVIPVEGAEIDIVPYVRLSGEVYMQSGDFDDLLAENPDAHVYVTLLKYMLNGDIDASELVYAYDYRVFEPEELAGQSSLSYSLMAPGETTVYLWATADVDDDEVLNESEDPVGCPNSGSCRIATGTSSQSGLDIGLQSYSDGE